MKKTLYLVLACVLLIFALAACSSGSPSPSPTAPAESAPSGVQTRPGSGQTGDPSAYLDDLVEKTGAVKTVSDGLVLIDLAGDGGEFMLRFSENSKWAEGVDQKIEVGNQVACMVKLEPTFTTPSQGEVFEVTANAKP